MPFLEMVGLSKSFGATKALDSVDLAVDTGEVRALVGENGSGKSTLMRILAGVIHPDQGRMRLDGREYAPHNPSDARRHGVAMVHQELSLCNHLSVAENVFLGVEPSRLGVLEQNELERRTRDALSRLGYPDLSVDLQVGKLPIATRQIVEIARAVAIGCRVVVFDEPTSSLTEEDTERLFEVVRSLRNSGHAVVYISHFLDEVREVCDTVTVLRDGEVVPGDGAGGDGFSADPVGSLSNEEIVRRMVGRSVDELYPRNERRPGEVVLEVRRLTGRQRPSAVDLSLRRGEVLGVAGLNGSGRTELLRAIFGLDPVVRGEVRVAGILRSGAPFESWRMGMGMLSEDRKQEGLALGLTIADNMTLPCLHRFGRWGWVDHRAEEATARSWAESLGIRCRGVGQKVSDLSGGNQQKVAIGRLLLHDVDVLLLDEPTRGIDVVSKSQIYQLIDRAALQGKAVLFVSSYLPELLGVCDRIAVMRRGRLARTLPASEWTQEGIMAEATGA